MSDCKQCGHETEAHYRLRNGKVRCHLCADWGKASHPGVRLAGDKEATMSCENCANAYDEGYTAGHNAENARLREQAEALAAVVKLARNGHHWCNDADQSANGMAVLCSRVKDIADKADAALRAYREGDCPGCSFRRQTGGNHDDVPTGDADPNCPYREGS